MDILALGIDTGPLEQGVNDATKKLVQIEGAADKAADAFDAFEAAVHDAGAAAAAAAASQNKLDAATTAAAGSAKQAGDAQETLAADTKAAEAAIKAQADELRRLQAELAQARAQMQAMGATINTMNKAMASLQAGHAKANVDIKATGGAYGLTTRELQMLAPQINDVVTQLSLGQGVMMTAMSQGPQIVQGFNGMGGALSALGRVLASVASSAAALPVAFAAIAGASLLAFNTQEGRIGAIRNELRGLTADYEAQARVVDEQARRIARSGIGVSRTEASQSIAALRRGAPDGSNFNYEDLTRQAAEYARVVGGDVVAASERFARAMRDPAALVRELAEKNYPGFNQALLRTVEVMANAGERADAFDLVMGRIQGTSRGAAAALTPLEVATRSLGQAWGAFTDTVGPWLASGGAALLNWLTGVARAAGMLASEIARIVTLQSSPEGTPPPRVTYDANGNVTSTGGTSNTSLTPAQMAAFEQRLIGRESGGRADAVNQYGYAGIYQMGTAALTQARVYQPAPGESTTSNQWRGQFQIPGFDGVRTRADFLASPEAQRAAFQAHLGGLNRTIDSTPGAGEFDRAGLLATAHGFGPRAMQEFVANGGQSDRVDGNGVRLDATYQRFIQAATGAVTAAQGAITQAAGGSLNSSVTLDRNDLFNRAGRIARGEDGRVDPLSTSGPNIAQIDRNLGVLNEARQLPDLDAASIDLITRAIEQQRAAREQLLSVADRSVRQTQEETAALAILDPVQRAVAQSVLAYRAAQRAQGRDADPADEARIMAETLNRLRAEYAGVTDAAQRQAASAEKVAEAYGRSTAAGQREEAYQRALIEVRRSGIQGEEQQRQAASLLADEYERVSAAANNRAAAEQLNQQSRDLDVLKREGELVGLTADQREREVAALRARAQLASRPGVTEEQLNEAERLARATAQQRQENTQLSNSWAELARVGEDAFNQVGQAITSAFANGSLKALDFGNIVRGVLSSVVQSILRLAVINPILNSLFGGQRGTLGGVETALAGGASAASGTGAATGEASGGSSSTGGGFSLSNISSLFSTGRTASGVFNGTGLGTFFPGGNPVNTGWSWLDGGLNTSLGWGAGASASAGAGTVAVNGVTQASGLAAGPALGNSMATYGEGIGAFSAEGVTQASGIAAGPGIGNATATYGEGIGAAIAETAAPQATGATVGQLLGPAVAIAGGAYGIYSGIKKGGIGGTVGALGGAVSAATGIAMLLGPAGAALLPALGALGPIGLAAGAALAIGSMFLPGKKPKNTYGSQIIDLGSGDMRAAHNAASAESLSGLAQAVLQQRTAVEAMLGGHASGVLEVGTGNRNKNQLITRYNGQDMGTFDTDEAGSKAFIAAATRQIALSMTDQLAPNLAAAVSRIDWSDLQQAMQDVTFAKQFEASVKSLAAGQGVTNQVTAQARQEAQQLSATLVAFNQTAERLGQNMDEANSATGKYLRSVIGLTDPAVMGDGAKALDQVKARFEELGPVLAQFGITAEETATALQKATDKIKTNFFDGIAKQLGDQIGEARANLKALQDAQKARLSDAEALGASVEQYQAVFQLNSNEIASFAAGLSTEVRSALGLIEDGLVGIASRLGVARNDALQGVADQIALASAAANEFGQSAAALRSAAAGLYQTRDSLRTGNLSALSPQEQLEDTRRLFDEALKGAMSGNAAAAQALGGRATDFLTASRAYNASGGSYQSDFAMVQAALTDAGSFAEVSASIADRQRELQEMSVRALNDIAKLLQEPSPDAELLRQQLAALNAIHTVSAETVLSSRDQANKLAQGNTTQEVIAKLQQDQGIELSPHVLEVLRGSQTSTQNLQDATTSGLNRMSDLLAAYLGLQADNARRAQQEAEAQAAAAAERARQQAEAEAFAARQRRYDAPIATITTALQRADSTAANQGSGRDWEFAQMRNDGGRLSAVQLSQGTHGNGRVTALASTVVASLNKIADTFGLQFQGSSTIYTGIEGVRADGQNFGGFRDAIEQRAIDLLRGTTGGSDAIRDAINRASSLLNLQQIMERELRPNGVAFANGGIMTANGAVPLHAYASGGIANSPQMALFGEGRMPEAYVPLPDGRTIPVTLSGDTAASSFAGGWEGIMRELRALRAEAASLRQEAGQRGATAERQRDEHMKATGEGVAVAKSARRDGAGAVGKRVPA